jgi:hypothetical protein
LAREKFSMRVRSARSSAARATSVSWSIPGSRSNAPLQRLEGSLEPADDDLGAGHGLADPI